MTRENNAMLQVNDIHANYGIVQALRGASLYVKEGEVVALIGPHGSGKTAILKAICGLLSIIKGEVLFGGPSIHNMPTEKIVALGIAYVDERKLIFSTMNVSDNLVLGAYHRYGKDGGDEIEQDIKAVYHLFPILEERRKQPAGTLSGGEQQMLAIGRALMSKPKLLLLDCPTMGLAPKLVNRVMKVISELRNQGVAILLIEQRDERAISIADRGYVVEEGKTALEGSAQELLSIIEESRFVSPKV